MAEQISFVLRVIIGIILACVMASNFIIASYILKKNSPNLKPMTIFQANYFVGHGLISLSGMVAVLAENIEDVGKICPKETFRYFFVISTIYDKLILQLDRLIAVRYPYFYKEKMDVVMAMKLVGISKSFSLAITIITSIIDPVYIYCPACGRCNFVRPINVYTVCYPGVATFILTLAVSIYVSKIIYKLNSVTPVVQISPMNTRINYVPKSSKRDQTEREGQLEVIEEETDSLEEINIENLLREIESKTTQRKIPASLDGPSTSKEISKRTTDNLEENDRNYSVSNTTQESNHKDILKQTLKMNLLTLAYLFILVPTQVTIIIYKNCDDSLGECDFFFNVMAVTMTAQVVAGFIHPLVFCLYLKLESESS